MRRAVLRAVANVFGRKDSDPPVGTVPLRLLMLGGDDLVLACGAPFALSFVIALAKEIKETTKTMPAGKGPLTLGAGVAIVPDSFPFYRAHELAEELARKRKTLESCDRLGRSPSPKRRGLDGHVRSMARKYSRYSATRQLD